MINSESAASGGEVVVVSGSPAQIPALAPNHAPSHALVQATLEALRGALARHPSRIVVVSPRNLQWYTAHEGSFRAWGAPDVVVAQGHYLGDLLAIWLLEQASLLNDFPLAPIEFADAIALGPGVLTVVVADGSAGLHPKAPLAQLDGAAATQRWCENLLGAELPDAKSADALAKGGVFEPDMWLELYRCASSPGAADFKRTLVYREHSLGVGRCVAWWSRERKAK